MFMIREWSILEIWSIINDLISNLVILVKHIVH